MVGLAAVRRRCSRWMCTWLTVVVPASCTLLVGGCSTTGSHWRQVNEAIVSRVQAAQPPLRGYTLSVDYRTGGRITLEGSAASLEDVATIGRLARSVDGVTEVDNRLIVKTPPNMAVSQSGDPRLADAIRSEVAHSVGHAWYKLEVDQRGEQIALVGEVDSPATAQTAGAAAQRVAGRPILNELHVRPPRSDEAIQSEVVTTLRREFPALEAKVQTSVRGGVVTLSGDMADHWDIDKVLAAVVMIDGVREVDSKVTINGAPYSSAGMIAHKK